mmetsp:Transcript_20665/g.52080  ORF Transcript_20665/g.52080 Transcript_20665/m.52080 type:complete len:209 (-) Transcript_20665:283-909(-)
MLDTATLRATKPTCIAPVSAPSRMSTRPSMGKKTEHSTSICATSAMTSGEVVNTAAILYRSVNTNALVRHPAAMTARLVRRRMRLALRRSPAPMTPATSVWVATLKDSNIMTDANHNCRTISCTASGTAPSLLTAKPALLRKTNSPMLRTDTANPCRRMSSSSTALGCFARSDGWMRPLYSSVDSSARNATQTEMAVASAAPGAPHPR